eukprot:GFUD01014741.1.p1 GENE.GFUD01014741.1~~GFUD01014741.1.p1  ORF type:complete len:448 (-),score=101.18 GFUD01014741.1:39-1232(-)
MGLIVMPTALVINMPLHCNFYGNQISAQTVSVEEENPILDFTKDPKFNLWWVRKACLFNGSVSPFMLYLPYILLIMALILFAIERIFSKAFKAGLKLEKLYKLLIHRNVLEDSDEDETDGKEITEVKQTFHGSRSYFLSFLTKTLTQLVVGISLVILLMIFGLPVIQSEQTISCNLHGGFQYECSGHPHQFYLYILYTTIAVTIGFIGCNTYNLVWLVTPTLGRLSNFMAKYRNYMRNASGSKSLEELLGDLDSLYYNNWDLKLLLDLLSANSGVASSIAIIAQFDKSLYNSLRPSFVQDPCYSGGTITIQYQGPISEQSQAVSAVMGAELMIIPEIHPQPYPGYTDHSEAVEQGNGIMSKTFWGIKEGEAYTVSLLTVLNGKVISQVKKTIIVGNE